MIGSYTADNTSTVGIYNTAVGAASEIALFNACTGCGNGSGGGYAAASSNQSGISFANVGLYIKKASGVTWFSQTSLAIEGSSGDPAGHQHFAVFTTGSDPNTFYVGMSDWVTGNGGEGNGDFQDIVLKINADPVVPEPATFGLLGAGLLGLGITRYRTRKSRA